MKSYPDIDRASAVYQRELDRHIDDPHRLAIFEVLWSGTRQYQQVIERQGLVVTQHLLASVLARITEAERRFTKLITIEAKAAAAQQAAPGDISRLAEPDFRRDTVTGRLVRIDNTELVVDCVRRANAAQRRQIAAVTEAELLQRSVESWRAAEARLRAAIVMHITEREQTTTHKDGAEPVQVVFSPDAQLRVVVESLPGRQTVSEVKRDSAGQIVSTVQTESDLAAEE